VCGERRRFNCESWIYQINDTEQENDRLSKEAMGFGPINYDDPEELKSGIDDIVVEDLAGWPMEDFKAQMSVIGEDS
jgi:hypothetical protein